MKSFNDGNIGRNAGFSLLQSVVTTACLFASYRIVIGNIGLDRFGVWSILVAGSTLVRVGDISGGGALARFVAMSATDQNPHRLRDLIHTVVLTCLGLNMTIGLAVLLTLPPMLKHFIQPAYLQEANVLVPYVVGSFVVGALATAVTSGIDGSQRADQRALVMVAGAVGFLLSCAALIPKLGIVGFGIAQIMQQTIILGLGWITLRRNIDDLGWIPKRWRRQMFFQTTGYAVKLNAIGVLGLFFEPLSKFALNHADGPGLVALYELASRMVVQVRGIAVAAGTPLVPAFAAIHDTQSAHFSQMLERTLRVAAWASVAICAISLVGAPVMSIIVLGHISTSLLVMNAALTLGWSINAMSVPFFFAAQGLGILRWNLASYVALASSVVVGVVFSEPLFGAPGLVLSIAGGLILSMLTILIGNAHALGALRILRVVQQQFAVCAAIIGALCTVVWIIAT